MDDGYVDLRRPVGEADIAALRLRARLHQPCGFGEAGLVGGDARAQDQPPGEIERAGGRRHAGPGSRRRSFSGDEGEVELGLPAFDHAVDRRAVARREGEEIAGQDLAHRNAANDAVGIDPLRRRRLQQHQGARRALGPLAELVVEIPAYEQEEDEADRRVEIGVTPALPRLGKADGQREDKADGDRHIHIRLAAPQRAPGRGEEGLARIDRAGRGDQRAEPVHRRARAVPHLLSEQGRPGRHREHHHIADAKARDPKRQSQLAALGVDTVFRFERVEGRALIAKSIKGADDGGGIGLPCPPVDDQPSRGQVQPRGDDALQFAHMALDLGEAAGAPGAGDQKLHARPAVRFRPDEARKVLSKIDGGHGQTNLCSSSKSAPFGPLAFSSSSERPEGATTLAA